MSTEEYVDLSKVSTKKVRVIKNTVNGVDVDSEVVALQDGQGAILREFDRGLKPIVEGHWNGQDLINDWENEILQAHAYKGKLYIYVQNKGIMVLTPNVGVQTSLALADGPAPSLWWNTMHAGIFKGNYYGVGYVVTPSAMLPLIHRFDGTTWTEVFRGVAANQWCGSIAQYGGELYVGALNVIYRSPSGDPGTWVSDFTFATDRTIYALVPLSDGNLYAFEGEPNITVPAYVYRKSSGTWTLHKTYNEVNFIVQHDGARAILGDKAILGSHGGKIFCFDGSKLLCLKQAPSEWQGITQDTMFWPKVVEGGRVLITEGAGSGCFHQSKLWIWDGLRLRKLLELPWNCTGVELCQDRLYLTGNTILFGGRTDADRDVRGYTPHHGFLLSLPIDILTKGVQEPAIFRVWTAKVMTGSTTYNSDDDGGVLIPCLGYERKTLEFVSTVAGALTISVDSDGSGTYNLFDTISISANTPKYWQTIFDFAFLQLSFTPTTTDATVTAKVTLSC